MNSTEIKTYPYTFDNSENSYDAGGNPNPYNASVSAVAYKIMARLADEMGETEEAAKYTTAYNTVTDSFAKTLSFKQLPEDKRVSESFLTGQWLSLHLKLGQIWTDEQTDYALSELDSFYHPYYWGYGNFKRYLQRMDAVHSYALWRTASANKKRKHF